MVLIDDILRGSILLLRPNGDRRAVLIATLNHKHTITPQAMEAREDIGGKEATDHLPLVQRSIRIRPRDADENRFRHTVGSPKRA